MKKIKAFIPNALTLGNLFCGSLAIIILISRGHISLSAFHWSVYLIFCSMLLDFLDGFVARLLNVQSKLGVQLDSLADLVSFGLYPSVLLMLLFDQVSEGGEIFSMNLIALVVVLGACYRLAKFNIEGSDLSYFKGLNTPTMTMFVIGFASHFYMYSTLTSQMTYYMLIAISIGLAFLMNSSIPLFNLKPKSLSLKDNWFRYLLIIISIVLLISFRLTAFTMIVPLYILLSIFARRSFAK